VLPYCNLAFEGAPSIGSMAKPHIIRNWIRSDHEVVNGFRPHAD
jgi:hypothetical protein